MRSGIFGLVSGLRIGRLRPGAWVLSRLLILAALFLVMGLSVSPAAAGCYEVKVSWEGGGWTGFHCFAWSTCSVSIRAQDGNPVHLAKLDVKECVENKRFSYKGYFDHDPKDPAYWSEADCLFQAGKVACVWQDKNGVSGTTTGQSKLTSFKPPKRGKPGNRIGAGIR